MNCDPDRKSKKVSQISTSPKKGKHHPFAGGVFLILGICMILAGAAWFLHNYMESMHAGDASDAAVLALQEYMEAEGREQNAGNADADHETGKTDAEKLGEHASDGSEVPDMDTVLIDGTAYIGYIEAPSLGMTLSVTAECDENTLRISPGRYSGNLFSNDLVIAGHNYASHFSPFRYLEVGESIVFTDVHGNRYEFEIVETTSLQPTAVQEMIGQSEAWDLTLYTCTLDGNARHTIRCRRISDMR